MSTQQRAEPTKPVSFRIPESTKERWQEASEHRDGGNVSRLINRAVDIRRAVDELIERENLLPESTDERGAA